MWSLSRCCLPLLHPLTVPKGLCLSAADSRWPQWLWGNLWAGSSADQLPLVCSFMQGQLPSAVLAARTRPGGLRERSCTAPGSLSRRSFVLHGECFPVSPTPHRPAKSSAPWLSFTGPEGIWCLWSCPPLHAEPALVLQPLLTGKCSSHQSSWCGSTELITVIYQCFLLVRGPRLDSVGQWVWLEARKSCSFYTRCGCLCFTSKPLMSNRLSWRCTEDTWFKCSKHWFKRIDVVLHLPPQHYLYLLIKHIIVKITYLKHNTFIQDSCVLKSS